MSGSQMTGQAIQKPQMSAKKQARTTQYSIKEQKSRNQNNQGGISQSKTINEAMQHHSMMNPGNEINSAARSSTKGTKLNSGVTRTKT